MADLVGIAGLTVAAFDKIWLIGSKTAEIISDYRHFDKVKTFGPSTAAYGVCIALFYG
jgi:hypothetical protein